MCTVVCVACVYAKIVSAWCEYMGSTHGSSCVSTADDVQEMSVG